MSDVITTLLLLGNTYPLMKAKPTMNQLVCLERKGGTSVRIIQTIATGSTNIGMSLLNDDDGTQMSIIAHNAVGNAEGITTEMFKEWLKGNGTPVTWEELVSTLRKLKFKSLADSIVDALCEISS